MDLLGGPGGRLQLALERAGGGGVGVEGGVVGHGLGGCLGLLLVEDVLGNGLGLSPVGGEGWRGGVLVSLRVLMGVFL